MKTKITRPPTIETLASVPGFKKPVFQVYDAWLRFSYRRLWNWHNQHARRAFESNKPLLNEVQQRVLAELQERGIAHVSFQELFRDAGCWHLLSGTVHEWLRSSSVQEQEIHYREVGYKDSHFKEYLVRWFGRESDGVLIPWNSPWLQLALAPEVLDIANWYFGMLTRMYHVDVWNTIALQHDGPLIGAQKWHRDPADIKLLKVFLYFTDVDKNSGAMQYVPHSRPGEKYGNLWPQDAPFDGARPPGKEFVELIPEAEWLTAAYPTGTLVFADTAGFHRGGRADKRNRVLATWAYSSQACKWPRTFRVDPATLPKDLATAARWALSMR
jgi:hypothetical protein